MIKYNKKLKKKMEKMKKKNRIYRWMINKIINKIYRWITNKRTNNNNYKNYNGYMKKQIREMKI